ncbi:MAG: polymerase subunit sigma-24 [Conexibacter sp.]|jgi:RNA polymerase sigma-70 factor, ECF subfamily|nr:polymerase subunit sigma-24 [Conexibacter sp.]
MDDHGTAEAIRQASTGDLDRLRSLYRCYAPEVYVYVRRIVPNHHDAEDVTQQVFLKLTTQLRKHDPQHPRSSAWMLRVARNAAIDHLRRERLVPLAEPREPDLAADTADPDRGTSLREAFDRLPKAQRDVLLLRAVVGLTPSEAAERLGTTQGAVNISYHRARLAARRTLESEGWTPATHVRATARA